MLTVNTKNVHTALPAGLGLLRQYGQRRESRVGPVLQLPEPLTTAYRSPHERVLFWPQRDANPFFHLFEALWMLAGRNDVAYVGQFARSMFEFSDDGVTLNGAYGHRWRHHFEFDQLAVIMRRLREGPLDRRCVLQMWDARQDLGSSSRDLPCNTQAFVQINAAGKLDLMVTNRSNDLVWGAYGANAVHFSMLQEYLAAGIGVPVGSYYQTSMNTHLYLDRHQELLRELGALDLVVEDPYFRFDACQSVPLVETSLEVWEAEAAMMLRDDGEELPPFQNAFLERVAKPMRRAWSLFVSLRGSPTRIDLAQAELVCTTHIDWHRAAFEWLDRRRK